MFLASFLMMHHDFEARSICKALAFENLLATTYRILNSPGQTGYLFATTVSGVMPHYLPLRMLQCLSHNAPRECLTQDQVARPTQHIGQTNYCT